MPWENKPQVEARVHSSGVRERLEDLYSLSLLAVASVFPDNFVADPTYERALVPSEHGNSVIAGDPTLHGDIPPADLALALLGRFYHHAPLLHARESDVETAIAQYSADLVGGAVRLPYRFGRTLYDKFNDTYRSDKTHYIDAHEVLALLDGTEQGVYQVGSLVTGPLGVLRSDEQRFLPPVLKLPLWHCSDTGCHALHNVRLRPADVNVVRAFRRLERAATDALGPPSEWSDIFDRLHRRHAWPTGRPYNDLAALVGDAILGQERTALLAAALASSEGRKLRSALASPPRKRNSAEGPAESLAAAQSEATQMQLLLLLEDVSLISLLDALIAEGRIRIPSNEVRRAMLRPPKISQSDRSTELSLYGARSETKNAIVALATLVWKAYEENGLLDDLAWRCDRASEVASVGMVLRYMRAQSPHDVIKTLVLPSRPVVTYVADKLYLRMTMGEPDDQFIKRALWKIGFTVARYDGELARFRTRLDSFNDTLLRTAAIRHEDDREVIRSAGVNVFVSVEHLLEELVSYNVWMLSSDHFVQTRFRYSNKEAVRRVPEVLGAARSSGDYEVAWNPAGGNTLGVLMSYMTASVSWMNDLLTRERAGFRRDMADRPHYADDPERRFPFDHTELWADSSPAGLKEYVEGYATIAAQLERSNLAAIRNGLDHKRDADRFPSLDSMIACCARLREAFGLAELQRYMPKTYWLTEQASDQYGRITFELRDYQDRALVLHGPSILIGVPSASYRKVSIVAPGNLLGEPNAELLFELNEDSEYSLYWSGYPRRRFISGGSLHPGSEQPAAVTENVDTPA